MGTIVIQIFTLKKIKLRNGMVVQSNRKGKYKDREIREGRMVSCSHA